ncbi:MAG: UPF0175 family protein [Dehalococcoidia bacterium]
MEKILTIELPDEVVALIGSPEAAAAKARELLLVELLREGLIGQSRAAHLLSITRWELLDLIVAQKIPSGPQTEAELRREVEGTYRLLEIQQVRGSHQ